MDLQDLVATIPPTNYSVGRLLGIQQISEHHAVGDAHHAIDKARIVGQEFSCTFTISMEGVIYQLVKEENTPYTDNDFTSNSRSITIEHAGGGDFPYTEAMYQASIKLHAYLFKKYGNLNCLRHRDIPEIKADPSKATACPGQLDVERIVREAKALIEQGDDMPNDGDIINFICAQRGDKNYKPNKKEIDDVRRRTFKDWAYEFSIAAPPINEGDVVNVYQATDGRAPNKDEVTAYNNKAFKKIVYEQLLPKVVTLRKNQSVDRGTALDYVNKHLS